MTPPMQLQLRPPLERSCLSVFFRSSSCLHFRYCLGIRLPKRRDVLHLETETYQLQFPPISLTH